MRKILFFFLISVYFFPGSLLSQSSEWKVLARSNELKNISFFDQDNGIILGDRSYYLTSNGGLTWSLPYYNNDYRFADIFILENGSAYGLAIGKFTKTTNFGKNWNFWGPLNTGSATMYFLNEQTGWVSSKENGYKIMKTTDAGLSWSQIFSSPYPEWINDVYFLNKDTGYVLTQSKVYLTINGGNNWLNVFSLAGDWLIKIQFIDSNTGWFLSRYTELYKTTNSGFNWVLYHTPGNFSDFIFLDEATGWGGGVASGVRGGIHKTTNSGQTWIKQNTQLSGVGNPTDDITSIYMKDYNTGWASTYGGYTLKTKNGGEQWLLDIKNNYGFENLFFADETNGWRGWGEKIYNTTNKGVSWNYVSDVGVQHTNDIFFNDEIGIVVTNSGTLFRSINNGISWDSILLSNSSLQKIKFVNTNTGFITGSNGMIWKTIDGGQNWTDHNFIGNFKFDKIEFITPETVYMSTDSNLIFRTTNGGENWAELFYPDSRFKITSISFSSNEDGWLTAFYDYSQSPPAFSCIIAKTTNAGDNWVISYSEDYVGYSYNIIKGVNFIDADTGYAITTYGKILKTTNGGNNWGVQAEYNDNLSNFFKFENKLWISGNSIIIYNGDLQTIGINSNILHTPVSFSLHQNYPNPFNPSTKIKFDIPKGALVKLKIYDILGREVAVLVNQKLNAGVYEYEWNGVGLPSGVYFYRLQAGDFIETKRMVLVK